MRSQPREAFAGVGVNGFTYAWNHEQPRSHFVSLSWSREVETKAACQEHTLESWSGPTTTTIAYINDRRSIKQAVVDGNDCTPFPFSSLVIYTRYSWSSFLRLLITRLCLRTRKLPGVYPLNSSTTTDTPSREVPREIPPREEEKEREGNDSNAVEYRIRKVENQVSGMVGKG